MEAARRNAQPVAAGFPRELRGFFRLGEAFFAGEEFFVAQTNARALVPSHGAKLRLHCRTVGTGKLGRLIGDGNVLRKRQAGTVDHNRLVSHIQRPFQKRKKIDSFLILVDGRDMIQVEQRITLFAEFEVLLRHSLRTLRFKLFPLQSGNLHHGDRVFIHDGLHHRFHHGQIGNIKCRDHRFVRQRMADSRFCSHI